LAVAELARPPLLIMKRMGKRNVCEALVVEVRAKRASEASCTILRIGYSIAASEMKEEKKPPKGLE